MRIPSEPVGLLSGEDNDARLLRRMEQQADASSGASARLLRSARSHALHQMSGLSEPSSFFLSQPTQRRETAWELGQ